jgi:hypothetical protein
MAFDLPRGTHRYFIGEISETPHPQVIMTKRFLKFHETLQNSRKLSVKLLNEISCHNLMTSYGQNLWNIRRLCDRVVTYSNLMKVIQYAPVPDSDKWKIDVVKDLLEVKWNISKIEYFDNYYLLLLISLAWLRS